VGESIRRGSIAVSHTAALVAGLFKLFTGEKECKRTIVAQKPILRFGRTLHSLNSSFYRRNKDRRQSWPISTASIFNGAPSRSLLAYHRAQRRTLIR